MVGGGQNCEFSDPFLSDPAVSASATTKGELKERPATGDFNASQSKPQAQRTHRYQQRFQQLVVMYTYTVTVDFRTLLHQVTKFPGIKSGLRLRVE